MLFPSQEADEENEEEKDERILSRRKQVEEQLALGELEDRLVTIEIVESAPSMFDMLQGSGMEQMGMNMQEAFDKFMPKNKKRRKLPVKEARQILIKQEAEKLIDKDEVDRKSTRLNSSHVAISY